ncbi:MAG TPA: cytochrome P450 [Pseudonocardia sp.]|jgi:cytochrome P450|nr:cytochrome P450 [Pseudonocardia sp.]
MDADQVDLASVDLMDGGLHAEGPPHEVLERLRSECPVHQASYNGQRYWSFVRDAEVVEVSRDPQSFSSGRAGIFLNPDQVAPIDLLRNVLLYKDPPEHSKYRRILSPLFTPKAVKKWESAVREQVDRALDAVIESGRCDFVSDIAVPVPLGVLAALIGVPDDDIDQLYRWTHEIERAQQSDQPAAATETFIEMTGYLHQLIQQQIAEGGDSLVTRLREAQVDEESLSDDEILTFFGLLVFAGNDTTRNTTATGMLALLENPEQWQFLRDNPDRLPQIVEEVLRYTSVVKYFARTATHDTEVGGHQIAEGDKVVIWFDSASRDESLNDDPERFDVTRENAQHRAFGGGGPHFCLGNNLARLELRILFEQIALRMPDIALDGSAEHLRSNWAHALTSMPVTFSASAPTKAGA